MILLPATRPVYAALGAVHLRSSFDRLVAVAHDECPPFKGLSDHLFPAFQRRHPKLPLRRKHPTVCRDGGTAGSPPSTAIPVCFSIPGLCALALRSRARCDLLARLDLLAARSRSCSPSLVHPSAHAAHAPGQRPGRRDAPGGAPPLRAGGLVATTPSPEPGSTFTACRASRPPRDRARPLTTHAGTSHDAYPL